jgi:hypothetical protein
MADGPDIRVELAATTYCGGEELTGELVIADGPTAATQRVEFSVLWHTSGKGPEDLGVIHFQVWKAEDGSIAQMPNPNTFAVKLPRTPWTYDGELIKIHWLVRVRLRFDLSGVPGEVGQDVPFVLIPENRR